MHQPGTLLDYVFQKLKGQRRVSSVTKEEYGTTHQGGKPLGMLQPVSPLTPTLKGRVRIHHLLWLQHEKQLK